MRSSLSQVVDALKSVLLGKEHQVQLALATLLAQGHLLIEDPVSYTHLTLPTKA